MCSYHRRKHRQFIICGNNIRDKVVGVVKLALISTITKNRAKNKTAKLSNKAGKFQKKELDASFLGSKLILSLPLSKLLPQSFANVSVRHGQAVSRAQLWINMKGHFSCIIRLRITPGRFIECAQINVLICCKKKEKTKATYIWYPVKIQCVSTCQMCIVFTSV